MATTEMPRTVLYASTGRNLVHYTVDANMAALHARAAVSLPEDGQYAWPHPNGRFLYIACSNGSPGHRGDRHCACALRIGSDGSPQAHGPVVSLPARPVHITTDIAGRHILIAYNDPSGLTVHSLRPDGSIGEEAAQDGVPDAGIFAHQTRLMANGRTAILVTRGNDATERKPEEPGALKIFDYDDGRLRLRATIAPGGGYGYGPRHVDFDSDEGRLFVSLERQNKLHVHRIDHERIDLEPYAATETLADPSNLRLNQRAGTLHIHPNGRFLYVANRADGTLDVEGQRVYAGGENNIAVYRIDDASAPPRLVQHADTGGIVPRTFAIDPSGSLLVAANSKRLLVQTTAGCVAMPASLALFAIADDGRLRESARYDVDVGGGTLFWMGMMRLTS